MQGAKRSITSRVTIKNPRPRKYASAAEKQAAFRARFPTLCVRVEPKTADTVQAVADASGRTQQETLLSMLKYAMTNRNWLTLGLTEHKQLPRIEEPRKENPMKRKPTPAQIAARERFAAMARSGAFKKKTAKAKAKPQQSSGEKRLASLKLSQYKIYNDIIDRVQSGQSVKSAYDAVLGKGAYERLAGELYDEARKTKSNPAKKTVSQKISQLVHEGYPQKQAVAIALSEERAGKVKRNPLGVAGGRYEILWGGSGDLKASYDDLGQAKDFLDDIDRPPGLFYGLDTKTGKQFFSFAAITKMQKAYKSNPRASNPISDIANIIYNQLGANRFAMMTGAKNFVAGDDFLMFSIGKNQSVYNKVRITLTPDDLYDLEFFKMNRLGDISKTQKFEGVYAEQLQDLFTQVTGLYTSMGTMGRRSNPRASNPQARSVKHTGARNIAYAVQAKRMLAGGGAQFETVAGFPTKAQAQDYIDALLKTYPKGLTLRISAA